MPTNPHQPAHPKTPHLKTQEALQARDALASALTRAGIQLPAMDVRTPWNDELDEHPHENPGGDDETSPGQRPGITTTAPATAPHHPRYALVHLGVCSAPVAHDLAKVIEKGVDAQGAGR